ncbi:hypothetical protein KJ586_05000 [Patescibacteria group bacterium]|nr:hypothetical protein [Patescibacteria group bacterium]
MSNPDPLNSGTGSLLAEYLISIDPEANDNYQFWGMIGVKNSFLKATRKRAQKTFHVSSGNDHRYRYAIDDVAVDHVDQYWLSGKTIPENARLTHR